MSHDARDVSGWAAERLAALTDPRGSQHEPTDRHLSVNGHEWTADEMRDFAEGERDLHDPANQEDNGYDRCAHCHYTRHPCSVHDLASMVLALLATHSVRRQTTELARESGAP